MQDHEEIKELIDSAASICGSYSALANVLGVTRAAVSNWRSGYRHCPAEKQAALAYILGRDPLKQLFKARKTRSKHQG